MKYSIILIFVIAFFGEGHAQTEKGSFMIGGSLRVQRSEYDIAPPFGGGGKLIQGSFNVSPTAGYFFVNNLMTGLQASYTRGWTLNEPDTKLNSASIGPVIRYYFPVGKFAFFPEVGAFFQHIANTGRTFDTNTGIPVLQTRKENGSSIRAGVGATWFVSTNIGIEAILAYQNVNTENTINSDSKLLYFNIGLQFYLPGKG